MCLQFIRPEGQKHYKLSVKIQNDQIVCVEELKLSLLAKSCLCPGFVALISNLISSSNDPPNKSELEYQWLEEYWKGKAYEIYQIKISQNFAGKSFSWVAEMIYNNFKAILFALEI